jgi:molybdate transport system regulatory protein
MATKEEYTIKSRIWIRTKNGAFLGFGRVALLKKIDEYGSISKAAADMKMSYKKAWELVNSMNSQHSSPLVIRKIGGKGGGGSVLSAAGKNAIKVFEDLAQKNDDFLNDRMKEIQFDDE